MAQRANRVIRYAHIRGSSFPVKEEHVPITKPIQRVRCRHWEVGEARPSTRVRGVPGIVHNKIYSENIHVEHGEQHVNRERQHKGPRRGEHHNRSTEVRYVVETRPPGGSKVPDNFVASDDNR